MLNDVQAREACHILLLRRLVDRVPNGLHLKGGVNLRLFYGSVRYSEDMDFDADTRHRDRMQAYLRQIVNDTGFKRELEVLGIDDVVPNDTQPTAGVGVKFKFNVVVGGVRLPTKVEVSFRQSTPAEWAEPTPVPPSVLKSYGIPEFGVSRYPHAVVVVQKVNALATRSGVQARDIFDLDWLLDQTRFPGTLESAMSLLRKIHSDENLRQAHNRCLDALDDQYQDQVESFLAAEIREQFVGQWEGMRLHVHDVLGKVLEMPQTIKRSDT